MVYGKKKEILIVSAKKGGGKVWEKHYSDKEGRENSLLRETKPKEKGRKSEEKGKTSLLRTWKRDE